MVTEATGFDFFLAHQREAYFGAKQVVGEEEYRLQAGWDEGLRGDGV